MEIVGNKAAIKGHSLHSYHHIIHSLVLIASSEPLPKGYRRKQYTGFFDVLTYLDFTLFRRTFCEILHFLGGLFVKYYTF